MRFDGQRRVSAPREVVWDALHDQRSCASS